MIVNRRQLYPMRAIVLCAGLGSRLRPLTDLLPKPMLEVGGSPLIAHQLRRLAAAGVREVAVNLHHLGSVVRNEVGNGYRYGVSVRYADEPVLRGSAGALLGFPGFFDRRFVVVYGDVYHEVDIEALAAFHSASGAVMTIAATTADDPTRCGVLDIAADGRVRSFVEKPEVAREDTAVNAGIYVCEPDVLDYLPESGASDFGSDIIPKLVESGEGVYALPTPAVVQDIGTPAGYERARLLAGKRSS
jgi:NDP-sugar pyrophosphorylase family protein